MRHHHEYADDATPQTEAHGGMEPSGLLWNPLLELATLSGNLRCRKPVNHPSTARSVIRHNVASTPGAAIISYFGWWHMMDQ